MGKGDWVRPYNREKFAEGYDRIFGEKKLNVWEDPPPKEEPDDGIQGDPGDGASDPSDSGRNPDVPQEPAGQPDFQAEGPVESAPCRNCGRAEYTPGSGYCDSCGEPF